MADEIQSSDQGRVNLAPGIPGRWLIQEHDNLFVTNLPAQISTFSQGFGIQVICRCILGNGTNSFTYFDEKPQGKRQYFPGPVLPSTARKESCIYPSNPLLRHAGRSFWATIIDIGGVIVGFVQFIASCRWELKIR
jgi:hypothetical protein